MKKITLFLSMIMLYNLSLAQIVSPVLLDNFLTSAPFGPYNIRCDMVTCPDVPSNHVRVVAWDGGNPIDFVVQDNMGNSSPIISIGGSVSYPDVAIACYETSPSVYVYRLLISHVRSLPVLPIPPPPALGLAYFIVELEEYDITGIGTTSLNATYIGTQQLNTLGTGTNYPTIDMFADPTALLGSLQLPTLRKCAVAFDEYDLVTSVGNSNIVTYDVKTAATPVSHLYSSSSVGMVMGEIACMTNTANLEESVVNAYYTVVNEINLTAGSIPTWNYYWPILTQRIEAMSLVDPAAKTTPRWVMIGFDPNYVLPNYTNDWYAFLNPGAVGSLSNPILCSTPSLTYAGAPCIAAGVGPALNTTNIGNSNFTIGSVLRYVASSNKDVFTRYINTASGTLAPNFYQVNFASPLTWAGSYAMGITSSSNSGDGLFTVWADNSNMYYKITSNTYGYKPTEVGIIPMSIKYSVFPNPATSELNVNCKGNETYNITDVTGRILLNGSFKAAKSTIDISSLPKGIYMLQIAGTEKPQSLKFVKE